MPTNDDPRDPRDIPNPERWAPALPRPHDLWVGIGLYDRYLAMLEISDFWRLFFYRGAGWEQIGDGYEYFAELDEAAFQLLRDSHD